MWVGGDDRTLRWKPAGPGYCLLTGFTQLMFRAYSFTSGGAEAETTGPGVDRRAKDKLKMEAEAYFGLPNELDVSSFPANGEEGSWPIGY